MNKKSLDTEKHFKTLDLFLASFLVAKGLNLIRTAPSSVYNQIVFVLEDHKDLETWSGDFYNGEAEVNVQEFIKSIKYLRSLIYQFKYNNNKNVTAKNVE